MGALGMREIGKICVITLDGSLMVRQDTQSRALGHIFYIPMNRIHIIPILRKNFDVIFGSGINIIY